MAGLLPKRSEYGRKILEKILGFRKFLETAEKERDRRKEEEEIGRKEEKKKKGKSSEERMIDADIEDRMGELNIRPNFYNTCAKPILWVCY